MKNFLIKEALTYHINETFHLQELRDTAIQFIEYQVLHSHFLFSKLTLLHSKMYKGTSSDMYSRAIAIEMLILAIDIIDDLEDEDNQKAPWCNVKSFVALNVATGFLLISKKILDSLQGELRSLIDDSYYTKLFNALNGQHMDLINAVENETDYIQIAEKKAGSLTNLACIVGAIHANEEERTLIDSYSTRIGVIGQIQNDLKAIYEWENKNDIRNKKKSLPIIFMISSKKDNLLKKYYNDELTYSQLYRNKNKAINELENYGAIHYARVIINIHKTRALNEIRNLNADENLKEKLTCFL